MKRLAASLLAIATLTTSLTLCLTKPTSAAPARGWVSTTTEGGVVNLRSGPSTNNTAVATAANGNPFSIIREQKDADGYTWYQIQLSSSVTPTSDVWLRSDLMSLVAPIAYQPQILCDSAIAQTESKIRSIYNTQISARTLDNHGYSGNAPEGRTQGYRFNLSNEGANSVMASPVLMNQLAAQLIESCPTVGLVTFTASTNRVENATYGYMPGRLVRPFACSAASSGVPPVWGEKRCLG